MRCANLELSCTSDKLGYVIDYACEGIFRWTLQAGIFKINIEKSWGYLPLHRCLQGEIMIDLTTGVEEWMGVIGLI